MTGTGGPCCPRSDGTYDGSIAQEKAGLPFKVSALRPIQMSRSDVLDVFSKGRSQFTTAEWIDFLLRSIGLEASGFDEAAKRVALLRMVPFVERNYNFVELGPRGTGKSHLFQQISPYAHLISGGKATVARMFVNMANGQRGLVCQRR
jgi:ATP-dependent Lon protease